MGSFLSAMAVIWSEMPAWLSLFAVAFVFFYLRKDIKSIKEDLNNHVTDTDKKIDRLDTKFDKIDIKFDKIDTKFDKIDSKIDQLKTDMHKEFSDNFRHLNLRFDKIIDRQNNESVSK